ncbi:MAG: hypothetical protein GKC04_09035, partial [Methanomicrobiales archaeon]|nr:hypothetical protein [Methanomicrobiales archaeon]
VAGHLRAAAALRAYRASLRRRRRAVLQEGEKQEGSCRSTSALGEGDDTLSICREHIPRNGDGIMQALMLSHSHTGNTRGVAERVRAAARLETIAGAIAGGTTAPPSFAPVSGLVKTLTCGPFIRNVRSGDRNFTASGACTGCGTCAQVCPAGNVTLEGGRPLWHHRCELCCTCLHFCPTEAIQLHIGLGTEGRGRYRHPDLTVADMAAQRREGPYHGSVM